MLILTKETQVLLHPDLGHSILCEIKKEVQKEGALIIIPFFN
jgi:hypothetical protein